MAIARTSGVNRKQRKELARRLRADDPGLEVMHAHAAGIDVGDPTMHEAVSPGASDAGQVHVAGSTGEPARVGSATRRFVSVTSPAL